MVSTKDCVYTEVSNYYWFVDNDIVNASANVTNLTLGGGLADNGLVLISQMFDAESGLYGYYIVNATDTVNKGASTGVKGSITLIFNGFDAVQIWNESTAHSEFIPASQTMTFDLGVAK